MATWDAPTRDRFAHVAGGMLTLADALDDLIKLADEDLDLTLLVNSRDWLRDRASIFAPTGEPEEGYPEHGAEVINLECYRLWKRMRDHG